MHFYRQSLTILDRQFFIFLRGRESICLSQIPRSAPSTPFDSHNSHHNETKNGQLCCPPFVSFAGAGVEPASQGYEPREITVSLPRVLFHSTRSLKNFQYKNRFIEAVSVFAFHPHIF